MENSPDRPEDWYVIKQPEGHCEIVNALPEDLVTSWGPFVSQTEAIARRIGLIRAGKCQPL
ncbi:MAG: hypothetical protein AB4040_09385 [Synechococcus sp.]